MRELMDRVLAAACARGATFADIRCVESAGTAIVVQDGRADRIATGDSLGAGVRVLVDGAWGFATSNRLEAGDMLSCVEDAVSMARAAAPGVTDPGMVCDVEAVCDHVRTPRRTDPRDVALEDRVRAVFELERTARSEAGGRLANSVASYADVAGVTYVANTQGVYIETDAVRCGISLAVTASDGEELQWASKRTATLGGYELMEGLDPDDFAAATARRAVALLSAKRPPAGKFDVIIDPIICGLLAHEAFGHNCEADAVWAGESIVAGKEGQLVAHEDVTIRDDPTLSGLNGSYVYDHEGVRAEPHTLVERGRLGEYLHSLETAARFGERPRGSARAMSCTYPPIVRMSNTFLAPGDWSLEEMIADTRRGLYLSGGNWGYVLTAQGQFTCNVEQAFAIEDGQLGQRYRNVSIAGLTLDTLRGVTAVGDDLRFELGGACGKNGQEMHVDAGGPHVRIADVVVGGRE